MIETSAPYRTLPSRRLAPFTSLRVGGEARHFLATRDLEQAAECAMQAAAEGTPLLFLGGGSNLLVSDRGLDGLVVRYAGDSWEVEERALDAGGDEAIVRADAGVPIAKLARVLAGQGWSGLEWASNVPGTVGGAVVNNAGAFGGDMAAGTVSVDVIDNSGQRHVLGPSALAHGYRSSALKRSPSPRLVVSVRYRLRRDAAGDCRARVKEYQQRRSASQPREQSAGSVFANPTGDFAGRLIELAGLKGHQIGGACISPQHANFIVNKGGATARDVHQLMTVAQRAVWATSGVWLVPEIELAGDWSSDELAALQSPPRHSPPSRECK